MEKYKLREIVFGLRDEYKKNNERLEALKKHINLSEDKKINEYEFYAYTHGKDKYVELFIKAKQSAIVDLLQKIYNSLIYDETKTILPIAREMNGDMKYLVLPTNDLYQLTEDPNQFYADVDKILNTDFVSKITTDIIKDENTRLDIRFTPSGIITHSDDLATKYPSSGIIYTSATDSMLITAYEDALFTNNLNNILNAEIEADLLPDYHRSIIDRSPNKDKRVIITGLSTTKNTQRFDINDIDNSTIDLSKKK